MAKDSRAEAGVIYTIELTQSLDASVRMKMTFWRWMGRVGQV